MTGEPGNQPSAWLASSDPHEIEVSHKKCAGGIRRFLTQASPSTAMIVGIQPSLHIHDGRSLRMAPRISPCKENPHLVRS